MKSLWKNPYIIIIISFIAIIILGTILLSLPIASKDGVDVSSMDAFFTATSAVCVTGLVVKNTLESWTYFGQGVILILIQVGGLSFMTFATMALVLFKKKIGLKDRLVLKEQLNQDSLSGVVKLVKSIVIFTFGIELIGAFLLMIRFIPVYSFKLGLWKSVFHSVSAFCNAGFDLLGTSLEYFKNDILINFTIGILVILGGLGFTVLIDIKENFHSKRFSLHTKIVVIASSILLIFGTFFFLIAEYNNIKTIAGESFFGKLLISFFQSVVARTAGFNSVDISLIRETSAIIIIMLMFIGASPASTGGGIKTTTFTVLLMSTIATIKGNKDINIFKKRLNDQILKKSVAITTISFLWVLIISITITSIEGISYLKVLFETVSAQGTVGMSMGITPDLSSFSKFLLIITMFLGRVGGLTLTMALSNYKDNENSLRYSEENLIVG